MCNILKMCYFDGISQKTPTKNYKRMNEDHNNYGVTSLVGSIYRGDNLSSKATCYNLTRPRIMTFLMLLCRPLQKINNNNKSIIEIKIKLVPYHGRSLLSKRQN